MAPSAVDSRGRMMNGMNGHSSTSSQNGADGKVDTMNPHDYVHFDASLKPKSYHIKGTDANSKVLFRDVNIIDSTGRDPFRGDVYIEAERIKYVGEVPNVSSLENNPAVRTINGKGRTLMSGLVSLPSRSLIRWTTARAHTGSPSVRLHIELTLTLS